MFGHIIAVVLVICCFGSISTEDKYKLEIQEGMKNCMAEPIIDYSQIKSSIKNEKVFVEGKIKITKAISGPVIVQSTIEKLKDGAWIVVMNNTVPDICPLLENPPKEIATLFDDLPPEAQKCPMPATEIIIKERDVGSDELSEELVGEFRWTMKIFGTVDSKQQQVACCVDTTKIVKQ